MHLLVNIWKIFLNTADPLLFFPSDNSAKRKQVQGFFGNKKVHATLLLKDQNAIKWWFYTTDQALCRTWW